MKGQLWLGGMEAAVAPLGKAVWSAFTEQNAPPAYDAAGMFGGRACNIVGKGQCVT